MPEFRFCPHCGHELARKDLFGRERAYCPACRFVHFHDPKLSVGGLVVEDGRVLLIRRGVIPRIGFWAVPSGFVEYDEQPRVALAREIEEETGLRTQVGRVIDVFPNADPAKPGVFLFFEATVTGGELQPGDDVSEARWFGRNEMPWEEMAFTEMREVLKVYWRKISAIATETYLEERAQRGDQTKFLAAMSKVADVEPPDERDRL